MGSQHDPAADEHDDSGSEASTTGASETCLSGNRGASDSRTMRLLARGMKKVMRPVTKRYGTEPSSRSSDGGSGGPSASASATASATVSQVTTPRRHCSRILRLLCMYRALYFEGSIPPITSDIPFHIVSDSHPPYVQYNHCLGK